MWLVPKKIVDVEIEVKQRQTKLHLNVQYNWCWTVCCTAAIKCSAEAEEVGAGAWEVKMGYRDSFISQLHNDIDSRLSNPGCTHADPICW